MNLDRVIVTVIVYDLIVAKIKPVLTYGTGPNDYFSNRLTTTNHLDKTYVMVHDDECEGKN